MKNPIYLALDFPDWLTAKDFLDNHSLEGIPVKVGLELFYREGAFMIEKLKENNHPIFLDLKLHDIPTTVEKAMRNLARLEVDMVNVHALGGSEMMKRAKEGLLGYGGDDTSLLAVTILTSMNESQMQQQLRINNPLQKQVTHLAEVSKESGADGVVCSVHEAAAVKDVCGPNFITTTPGIRLKESALDDQKRVATPKVAKQLGADFLVIGRSITKAEHPKEAYENALKEYRANGV